MDTGMLTNNNTFYSGFEDEPEIELFLLEKPEYNIHIWDGYFTDIFGEPPLNGDAWSGFTLDCNQMERTFEEKNITIDINEYYLDLINHKDKTFSFEETQKCYDLLCAFLEYAKKNQLTVVVNWW